MFLDFTTLKYIFFLILGSHGVDYEACGFLVSNAVYFVDSPAFLRNIRVSPPSSGSKRKPSKKPAQTGDKLNEPLMEDPA
jgi:hypothetical protein